MRNKQISEKLIGAMNNTWPCLIPFFFDLLTAVIADGVHLLAERPSFSILALGLFVIGILKLSFFNIPGKSSWLLIGILGSLFSANVAAIKSLGAYDPIFETSSLFVNGPIPAIQVGLALSSLLFIFAVNYIEIGLTEDQIIKFNPRRVTH